MKLAEPFLQELEKHGKSLRTKTVKMLSKCATGWDTSVTERVVGAEKQKSLLEFWGPKNSRKRRAS